MQACEKNENTVNDEDPYGLISLTIPILKNELKARNLRLGGNKAEIIAILIEHIEIFEDGGEEDDIEVSTVMVEKFEEVTI